MVTTNGLGKLHIPIISRAGKKNKQMLILKEEAEKAVEELRIQQRQDSIYEAKGFLRDFVNERWSKYWSQTRIKCSLTMPELVALGYLPQHEGTKECRRLISVPVKFDEIGSELWKRLAGMVQDSMLLNEDNGVQEAFERQTANAYVQATSSRRDANDYQVLPDQHEARTLYQSWSSCETQQRGCMFCGEGSVKHESLPPSIREEPYTASNDDGWLNPQNDPSVCEDVLLDRQSSASKSFFEKLNIVRELGTRTVSIVSANLAYGYGYQNVLLDRTRVICLDA